jgi:hypothetical protein
VRLDRRHRSQLPSQTTHAAFEVVDGELGVDGLLEANDWVAVKTTVVPVATGVRLGIDTSCVSCGAQAPGNVDLFKQIGRRKEPRHQVLNNRYQGSFD